MHSELKDLKYISRKILPRKTRAKIKKIKDKKERIQLFRYSIKSALEMKMHEIDLKIQAFSEKKQETFFISTKANLLKNKIKYFIATYNKKEFIAVYRGLKNLKKELKKINV